MFRAASIVFFAYIGFDAVSTAAGETKDPQRNMPIGLLGSLAVCTIIYIVVCAVMDRADALHQAGHRQAGGHGAGSLCQPRMAENLGRNRRHIAGLSSVVLVMMMGQTRIAYTISRDGLLPQVFGKVHAKYRTPHWSTVIVGAVAAALAGLVPLNVLGELVAMGTLLAFATVCIGVLIRAAPVPRCRAPSACRRCGSSRRWAR